MSTPSTSSDVLATVSALAARFAPGSPATVGSDQELVRDLGYDSVRLVELLLACGDAFAIELPIEQILEGKALSVSGVVAHIASLRAGS